MDSSLRARATQWLSGPPHAARVAPDDVPAALWGPAVIEAAMSWRGYLWQLLPYAPYATPHEKVAIVLGCGTPNRDAVLDWMRPLDRATVDALESASLALSPRGDRLLDFAPTLLALVWIVALGELGEEIPVALDRFVESDLGQHDHQLFDLTRAALAALPAPRRSALVAGALARNRMSAVHVLTEVRGDVAVLAAALDRVVECKRPPHDAPMLGQGLAGGGSAMATLILERLASGRAGGAEVTLVHALSELEDRRAVPALLDLVGSTKRVAREQAALALCRLAPLDRALVEEGARARKKAVASACRYALEVADHPTLGRVHAAWRDVTAPRRGELSRVLSQRTDVFDRLAGFAVVEAVLGAIAWAMACDKHVVRNRVGIARRAHQDDAETPWALAYALICWPLFGAVRGAVEEELRALGPAAAEAATLVYRAPTLTPDAAMARWLTQHA